jgi:hypothetical protein
VLARCWCGSASGHFYGCSSPTGHRSGREAPCANPRQSSPTCSAPRQSRGAQCRSRWSRPISPDQQPASRVVQRGPDTRPRRRSDTARPKRTSAACKHERSRRAMDGSSSCGGSATPESEAVRSISDIVGPLFRDHHAGSSHPSTRDRMASATRQSSQSRPRQAMCWSGLTSKSP